MSGGGEDQLNSQQQMNGGDYNGGSSAPPSEHALFLDGVEARASASVSAAASRSASSSEDEDEVKPMLDGQDEQRKLHGRLADWTTQQKLAPQQEMAYQSKPTDQVPVASVMAEQDSFAVEAVGEEDWDAVPVMPGEHEFIPLAVARHKVSEFARTMKAMKTRHVEAMQTIMQRYEAVSTKERQLFQDALKKVKVKSRAAIVAQKEEIERLKFSVTRERRSSSMIAESLEAAKARNEGLQQQFLREKTEALENQKTHYEELIAELEQKLANSQSHDVEEHEQVIKARAGLDSTQGDLDEANARLAETEKQLALVKKEKLLLLNGELSDFLQRLASSAVEKVEVSAAQSTAQADAERVAELDEERNRLKAQIDELEGRTQEIPGLKAQLETLRAGNAELETERDNLQAFADSLVAKQDGGDGGGDVITERLAELTAELKTLKAERGELREQQNMAEAKAEEGERAQQQLEEKIARIEAQRDELRAERDTAREKNVETERQVRQKEDSIRQLESTVSRLREQVQASAAASSGTVDESQLKRAQERLREAEGELAKVRAERDELLAFRKQIEASSRDGDADGGGEAGVLRAELTMLRSQNERMKGEQEQRQSELDALQAKLQAKEAELATAVAAAASNAGPAPKAGQVVVDQGTAEKLEELERENKKLRQQIKAHVEPSVPTLVGDKQSIERDAALERNARRAELEEERSARAQELSELHSEATELRNDAKTKFGELKEAKSAFTAMLKENGVEKDIKELSSSDLSTDELRNGFSRLKKARRAAGEAKKKYEEKKGAVKDSTATLQKVTDSLEALGPEEEVPEVGADKPKKSRPKSGKVVKVAKVKQEAQDGPSQEEHDAALAELQKALDAENKKHAAELQGLEEQISSLKSEITRLKLTGGGGGGGGEDGGDGAANAAAEMIDDLNAQLKEAREERDGAKAREEQLSAKVEKLRSKLQKSMENTEKVRAKYAEVSEGYKAAKEKAKELQKQMERSKGVSPEALAQLRKELAEAQKQLKSTAAASKRDKQSAEKELRAELQRERKEAERELKQELAATKKSLESQLEKATKDATKYEREYNKVKGERDAVQEELTTVTAEAKKLKATVSENARAMAALREAESEGAAAIERNKELEKEAKKAKKDISSMQESLREEQMKRKRLHNELQDLKGKIRVYCRCRPMNSREKEIGEGECVRFPDPFTILLKREGKTDLAGNAKFEEAQYEYDQVFNPRVNGTQEEVFEELRGFAQSAVDGFNTCIFAYGQTGSGKTYTMGGVPGAPGLKPRFIQEVFEIEKQTADLYEYEFSAYMFEIYLDRYRDLFWRLEHGKKGDPPELKPMKDKKKGIIHMKNAVERVFTSAEEMLDYTDRAEKTRETGATKMNAGSSRSHLIFAIKIMRTDKTDGKKYYGKLSLVDLAGSESADKTEASGQRLKEAKSINRSLAALSNVMSTLARNKKGEHIPYRSNKLTQVLEDSLGGNAKTAMMVNISPSASEYKESSGSLRYGQLVRLISNNADVDVESEELAAAKALVKKLRAKLLAAREGQQVDLDDLEDDFEEADDADDKPDQE